MSWVRIDDLFPEHPKVVGLSDAAFRAYIEGLCYANRHLTDGVIPARVLERMGVGAEVAGELVEARLWHEAGSGAYAIHDYASYQQTREAAVEKMGKSRRRQAEGRRRGFQAVRRDAAGRFASGDANPQVGPLETASSGAGGSGSGTATHPIRPRPYGTRPSTEGSRSSTSSQDLDLQGAGPSEDRTHEPEPEPPELSEDLAGVLTDDQCYLLRRIVTLAPAFADLLPAHVLKLRKAHGDPELTAALRQLVEFDALGRVRKPASFLETAVANLAGETEAVVGVRGADP